MYIHFSVERDYGGYAVRTTHSHRGFPLNPCEEERYERLSWLEVQDLISVLLEERRPGAHPGGWEQLELC